MSASRRKWSSSDWVNMNTQRWSAARVLNHFGIVTPAVDVLWIAREVGADVQFVSDAQWDGALESSSSGYARMYINASTMATRQRFTIAHEIGHLVLHRPGRVFRDKISSTGNDAVEAQANQFAADLLMPRAMIEPLVASGRTRVAGLADLFQVSPRAMEIRLTNLGYAVKQSVQT